jgi:hypothetical protein
MQPFGNSDRMSERKRRGTEQREEKLIRVRV